MNSAEKTQSFHRTCNIYVFLQYYTKDHQVLWLKDLEFCFGRKEMLYFIVYITVLGYDMIATQHFEILLMLDKWKFLLFVEILTSHLERQKILVVTAADKFELNQCLPVSALRNWRAVTVHQFFSHCVICITKLSWWCYLMPLELQWYSWEPCQLFWFLQCHQGTVFSTESYWSWNSFLEEMIKTDSSCVWFLLPILRYSFLSLRQLPALLSL